MAECSRKSESNTSCYNFIKVWHSASSATVFFMMTLPALVLLIIFVLSVLLLTYIYVGYPVLIVLIARFFRNPVRKKAIAPSVTIVIPTFNEEVVIREKLENTLQLDYPRDHLQILVCDDASNDNT